MYNGVKPFVLLVLIFLLIACSNEKEAHQILEDFYKAVPDVRETVFDVSINKTGKQWLLSGETDSKELKNRLLNKFGHFNIVDQITLLPDSSAGNKTYGLINISVANLRADPSHSAELATQGLMGMPVKILKRKGSWLLVQTPDRYISWIDNGGLYPITETEFINWKKSKRIIILKEFEIATLNISFDNQIVSDLAMGNILEFIQEENNHFLVKFPDKRTAYIPKEACTDFKEFAENSHPDKENIITLAKTFVGHPYLWGGTSSRAMDCSGFIKMLYYMNGVILARDASLQALHGKLILPNNDFSNFQMGDLLFFGSDSTKITHVALSLGGTEYVHSSGMVKINSFNPEKVNFSEYRKNSFIKCRKIIGEENSGGIIRLIDHDWYFN